MVVVNLFILLGVFMFILLDLIMLVVLVVLVVFMVFYYVFILSSINYGSNILDYVGGNGIIGSYFIIVLLFIYNLLIL